MINRIDEIQDDELRVIGRPSGTEDTRKPRKWLWIVMAVVIVAAVVAAAIIWSRKPGPGNDPGVFDPSTVVEPTNAIKEKVEPLGNYADTTGKAYTEHLKLTINDIPLDIYIPHNAKPSLSIGTPDMFDKNIVFVTQAADIRADNGKINGAFVLAGKPMAWGLSKKGYVGIIDDKITVGVADNSPLFEEATEKGGYFFRQYPLVDNGVLVENEPKGKAIRKAICDRSGEIIVVMSITPESFHDFAQALVDFGVDNAIYLVGSTAAYGWAVDADGVRHEFGNPDASKKWKNTNYLVMRAKR